MMQIFVQNNGSAECNLDVTCRSTELPVLVINPEGGKSAAVKRVIDEVPPRVDGLPLSYIRFEDYDSEGNMNLVAVYASEGEGDKEESEEEEESVVTVNGGGGTAHITEALVQTRLWGTKDAGTAIGWNGRTKEESEVSGVDIGAANCRLSISKSMRFSKLSTTYVRKLLKMIGRVNSASFKGWDRGEVLFEDFSYSAPEKGQKYVTVTFNFAIQMNESGYSYAGRTLKKEGWEYIWGITEQVKKEKDGNNVSGVETKHAYRAQVYPYADFSSLGL